MSRLAREQDALLRALARHGVELWLWAASLRS